MSSSPVSLASWHGDLRFAGFRYYDILAMPLLAAVSSHSSSWVPSHLQQQEREAISVRRLPLAKLLSGSCPQQTGTPNPQYSHPPVPTSLLSSIRSRL